MRDSFHIVESEISFPIPKECLEEITASNLYPTILSDEILISKWHDFCRSKILSFLQKRGLIDVYHSKTGAQIAYDVTELLFSVMHALSICTTPPQPQQQPQQHIPSHVISKTHGF